MGFGNLKSDGGLQALNDYLAERSYIEGYVPSQADVAIFVAVGAPPPAKFLHALRWFNHIASYSDDERLAFPGVQKPLDQYGSSVVGATGGEEEKDEDDDDFELFGSDGDDDDDDNADEDEATQKLREKRLEEYAAKKAKKPGVVAKSNIILDVKPWDDETDMNAVEKMVRGIEADGLLWGASKLVPLAYGIKKLQISCVVEDDKVGTDFLEESITAFEDYVQSVDIAAFNKI